ncbi:MAG: hypothetical protein PF495_03830 [Spirochaetales bacterium]|jgi:hypothetical protein|nr:hypothetical protein [Spirochaetales bacterium]
MTPPTDTEIATAFKYGCGIKAVAEHYGLDDYYIEEAIRRYLMEAERESLVRT